MKSSALPLALAVVLAGPVAAQDLVLGFPDGAAEVVVRQQDYGRYAVPIAPAERGTAATAALEGAVAQTVYQIPGAPELDVLMASLRMQLSDAGYLTLLDCTARQCGGYDFRQSVETLPPPEMIVDLARFGYLAARHPDTERVISLIASLADGIGYVQTVHVTPSDAPAQKQAPVAASDSPEEPGRSKTGLFTERGSVVLEGLEFDTGSATLSDAIYPSLKELSDFLRTNSDAAVTLVGHTDAEGALAPNIALSRQRAEAVRTRLIEGFEVNPAQLTADGVGYLAPRATNATRDGRLLNRRVEAVLTAR
ncbi:OmpA family protein [Tropicimonas sp. S265A]|uniref:OmpA family protein n=1 Tax=Tropicimonas sp. S265A TaxID=3415134 RepID=UPI003C7A3F32